MRRTASLATMAALIVSVAGCAKVVVVEVPQGSAKVDGEGVFYALPLTVARVLVKADQKTARSAPYARFAKIFAPGSKPPCGTIVDCAKDTGAPVVKYDLQDGVTFTPFGEPDPTKVFMVKFAGGGAVDQTLSMTWNDMGLLSAASATVTNRTTDIVVSGIKAATGLAAKVAGGSALALQAPDKDGCPKPGNPANQSTPVKNNDPWIIKILLNIEPDPQLNVLIANYCDLPPTDRVSGTNEDSRDDFDETRDEEALLKATRAYDLRLRLLEEQRTRLLTSSQISVLEPDKYLDRVEKNIEQQVSALFVGSEATKTWELPFEVRTIDPTAKPEPLVRFGETGGVCPVTTLLAPDAKPAPSGFSNPKTVNCDKVAAFSVAYHPALTSQLASRVKTNVSTPTGDRSFRYMIPVQVKATVAVDTKSYGAGVFPVAQLGEMVSLPAKRNSKSITYDLAMIEATGGLKTFKLGTTGGLDSGTIDALSGAAGTVVDARNAKRKEREEDEKAAATATDELTVLTRQHSLLKLKDEICELQKKYGLACTIEP
jgi:hypothetical protein